MTEVPTSIKYLDTRMKRHLAAGLLHAVFMLPVAHAITAAFNFADSGFLENTGIDNDTENTNTLNAIAGFESPTWYNLASFTDANFEAGTGVGEGISVSWWASNAYAQGSEGVNGSDASQQVFRVYLDDADEGGDSYAPGDGYGASISLTGLFSFLSNNGASAYRVTLLLNTDLNSFTQPVIRAGELTGINNIEDLAILGSPVVSILGDGTQPITSGAGTNTDGTRAIAALSNLNADSITIALPSRVGDDRGSVAGFAITAVPEPSTTALLGFGWFGILLRRRR